MIEENFDVTFDEDYMRKKKIVQIESNKIFPENQVDSEPVINFDDDISLFFDEPVKALDSEANAEDNKQDELLKVIEETAADSNLTEEQEIPNPIFEGESHPINDTNEVPV